MPDDITLHVSTPAGAFSGTFSQTTKVSAVIAAIVDAKELEASEEFKLFDGEEQLAPERTLVSYQLGDEATLSLLARGEGV